jgi:hypothetical protein
MATRKQTAGGTSSATPAQSAPQGSARAQAEFQHYKARLAAGQGAPGAGGNPAYAVPLGFVPPGGAMPGWALPPSLTVLPQAAGMGGFGPAMLPAGPMVAGSLAERIGSSLRLGLDVVNAVLAGSARVLDGMYGGYGYPEAGCGCGSCCESCCCSDCCGCGGCGCTPSVGCCC